MASNGRTVTVSWDGTVTAIIIMVIVGFFVYLLWPSRSSSASSQTAGKQSPLNALAQKLANLAKKKQSSAPPQSAAPIMVGSNGGGGGGGDSLGSFLNFVDSIGLTPADAQGASIAAYDSTNLDNYVIPDVPLEQFDVSQIPTTYVDPNAPDPGSIDTTSPDLSGSYIS